MNCLRLSLDCLTYFEIHLPECSLLGRRSHIRWDLFMVYLTDTEGMNAVNNSNCLLSFVGGTCLC